MTNQDNNQGLEADRQPNVKRPKPDSLPLREKLIEILGLETAPDDQPEFLLTRDENGTILEGVSFSEELDQILNLFSDTLKEKEREARLDELELINIQDEIEDWQDSDIYKMFTVDIPMRMAYLKVQTSPPNHKLSQESKEDSE